MVNGNCSGTLQYFIRFVIFQVNEAFLHVLQRKSIGKVIISMK